MPTAKKAKPRFNEAKFVGYSLSKEQKAELKKTVLDEGGYDTMLLRLCEEGYKVTFREDTFNSCHAVWLVPANEENPNFGYILTGRGSTPLKALKQAAYIHYQVFDSDWGANYQSERGEELDD